MTYVGTLPEPAGKKKPENRGAGGAPSIARDARWISAWLLPVLILIALVLRFDGKLDRDVVREVQGPDVEFTRVEVERAAVVNRVGAWGKRSEHHKIAFADR